MIRLLLKALIFIQAICLIDARSRKNEDEFDTISDYLFAFAKVTVACSPIIGIGAMLFFAREDDETEAAKLEEAKKSKSCKS